ncbi:DUF4123 domain-containing protein [Vibrio cholerae]|uniref:DUF4123 domain-containing protein n=1 Tax=Vibrio cholerae TaxID=666 RepID=UPI001D274792|nr:DUF4123 domain-containing protein [Vibrio cholerae]EGR4328981.1 DUF4123 domain-containing protein [Vibrio cholerae]EGR4485497.1 DUF4123 domain-containing protein [Vibrio cholerae]MCX9529083.1 DUF4123 domain-containing protein [Vibrio cholerae]GHZ23000.1 hypothetical protein VCSRO29_1622 [Vibrio cholerae]HDG1518407.1 DUF4123 domain-containing protein [Vibrio cholerae]
MIQQWLMEQKTPTFWLLDQQAFKCVIAANNGIGFDGTQILFHGETFAPVMSLSPWLIPVSDKVLELSDELLQQGIFLTSHSSTSELLSHLQSLLIAVLEGEEVLFRFYDRQVIVPMLNAMRDLERNDFLGPVEKLAAVKQGVFQEWGNTRSSEFIYQPAPWWKLQPYHLMPLYRTEVHAQVLERRFWEKLPYVMEQLDEPQQWIKTILDEAKKANLGHDNAEYLVLNHLWKASLTTLEQMSDALHLNQQELQEIMQIREKLA